MNFLGNLEYMLCILYILQIKGRLEREKGKFSFVQKGKMGKWVEKKRKNRRNSIKKGLTPL